MSDIILFPGLKSGLRRRLKDALSIEDHERTYEIIIEMEKYFELSDDEQIIKLEVLKALHSYIELREECSILLNQGHPAYAKIISLFLESLYELGQYRTVIELIDALKEESVDHHLVMQLLPLYDSARHQLNQQDSRSINQLSEFSQLSVEQQIILIVELIHDKNDKYSSSIKYLVERGNLNPKVQTMMLEYLSFANLDEQLKVTKWQQTIEINPSQYSPVDSHLMRNIRPSVINWFELNEPSVVDSVSEWMTLQNILLFPLDKDMTNEISELMIDAYQYVISEMFGLEQPELTDEKILKYISLVKEMNKDE